MGMMGGVLCTMGGMDDFDAMEAMADDRHEFGEHGGVNMSIEASTTFTVMQAGLMPEIFSGRLGPEQGGCYLYGRHFNPTVYVTGRQMAALEGAEAGYCTASGMGAISSVLMQLCEAGDQVVASNTIYGGSYALLHDYFPARTGVQTTFVDITDLEAVERAMTLRTKVLYVESMANPTLVVADIPKLAEVAHRHGVMLVVDNTFTPMILCPIRLGADVVVHSATKFISGASDIIAGVICGTTEFIIQLMDLKHGSLMLLGATMDPQVAFRLSLRLPHLGMRVKEHSARAMEFSRRLRGKGLEVVYPGLEDHPQHALLKELGNPDYGYGGLFGLDLGTAERANGLMDRLQNEKKFGYMAVSLGYFETLMSCSGSTTSSEMSEEEQRAAGISPGLVRMSMGYTGSVEQRWRQLEEVLGEMGVG